MTSCAGSIADTVIRHMNLLIGALQVWDVMSQLHRCRHTKQTVQSKTMFSALVCMFVYSNSCTDDCRLLIFVHLFCSYSFLGKELSLSTV